MENQTQRKPRILCLHGFRTSGEILKKLAGRLPQTVLEKLDLVFLDAPFPAEGKSDVEGIYDPPYYEWFQANEDYTEYTNFEECLAYMEDYMLKHGPFDGVLGFSMGGMLAALLPGMQEEFSSSSFPFRSLPLPLPILLASFEAKPVSSEALSAFSKALSYTLVVFSSSNNCIAHSSTVNPPFIGVIGGFQRRIGSLLGNFRFDFFKIRSIIFRKPSPYTRPSTVFLGVSASVCHQNRPHTTSTRRSVTNTRQRVDLTRRRVQFTRHPLRCCSSNAPPYRPPSPPLGVALTKVPKVKFLIIISGAKFGGSKYGAPKLAANALSSPIKCPSLHFIGEKDFNKEDGTVLLESFVDPVVIHHTKGHTIPKLDDKAEETLLKFIEKIQVVPGHEE